jgi:hypothetical protein
MSLFALLPSALVLAVSVLALSACNGESDAPPAAGLQAGTAPADTQAPPRRALADAAPITIDALFNWAEQAYAPLFPQHVASQSLQAGGVTYTVRFYPTTGNYVGVDPSGGVWGYGPFTNGTLTSYGAIGDFTCLVSPGSCPPSPPCTTVSTGFSGDLNALYPNAGGDSTGSAGDSDGSAGVGGSEGKVLGARVSVYRLRDGQLLGQGLTDPQLGMVTVKWCQSDLPVLLEMQGAPGATYYDEALDQMVEFPLTQKLRALVDRFDENVGVSAQTEAAYLFALNQLQGNAGGAATTRRPLSATALAGERAVLTDGIPVGLTGAQVRLANGAVLAEVNRRLTDRLKLPSMKALATPIDQTSNDAALPRNRYGRMAALTGGFAKLARSYNETTPTPALTFTRQFARDFTDGRIDDYALDGRAVSSAGQATYRGTESGLAWTVGQGVLGQRFGRNSTRLDGNPYVQFKSLWLGYSALCKTTYGEVRTANYYLSTFGTVTEVVWQAPPGGCLWDAGTTSSSRLNVLTGIRKIVASSDSERVFAIGLDGAVYGWGRNGCGRVADGVVGDTFVTEPRRITGLPRVVDIVPTFGINVALTANGDIYTWGGDYNSLSGQPPNAADPVCNDTRKGNATLTSLPVRVIAQPRKVAGLSDIVSIAGRSSFVNAVRADGKLFAWGNVADAQGRVFLHPTPTELLNVPQPRKVVTTEDMAFGLTAGGQVLAWWTRPHEIFDVPSALLKQPVRLGLLDDIVDLAADPLGTGLALRADGTVHFWGRWLAGNGAVTLRPRLADLPVRVPGSTLPGRLPAIVRLEVIGNFAAAIGADNIPYLLTPGLTEADFRWEALPNYAGVPDPF